MELNFKDLFGNVEINFEKLASEMEDFELSIDNLAQKINIIRTQVEDNVE